MFVGEGITRGKRGQNDTEAGAQKEKRSRGADIDSSNGGSS